MKKQGCFALLIGIFILFSGTGIHAQYSWRKKACLPSFGRAASCNFELNGKLYVVGGYNLSIVATNQVWQYDFATDTWVQKSNFPITIDGASPFVINDTAYVCIGMDATNTYRQNCWRYNEANDTWSPIANFPGPPRYLAMTFVLNGKGYLGCGKGGGQNNDFYEYDPSTNLWTRKADFPGSGRQVGFGATIGNFGYMGLGWNSSSHNDVYRYNPTNDTWTQLNNFAGANRLAMGYFVLHDTLYIAAGRNPNPLYDDCWRYNAANDTWVQEQSFSCISPPLATNMGVVFNNHGYLVCGDYGNNTFSNQLLQFGPDDVSFTRQVNVLGNDTTYCGGFSRILRANASCARWSTGASTQQITVNTTGTYWVRYADTCGMSADTIRIISAPGTTFSLGNDTTYCGPFSRTLSTGIANTTWSTGATGPQISVATPGTYWAAATTPCGIVRDTIRFMQTAGTTLYLGPDTLYCNSFTHILSANNNPNAVWSTGATGGQIFVLAGGTYWATINTACGPVSDTITILQNLGPPVSFTGDTTLCTGQSLLLNAGTGLAGITYRWNNSSTDSFYHVTSAGTYSVTATNHLGCSATDAIRVSYNSLPPLVNLGPDTTYCGAFTKTLTAGVSNALWSNGATAPQITVTTPGTYWAVLNNGCGSSSDTVLVNQQPAPAVNLGNDTTLCIGQSLPLNAGNGSASTYSWQDNSTDSIFTVSTTGIYSVTATNSFGCSTPDNISVTFNSPPPLIVLPADTTYCGTFTLSLTTGSTATVWSTGITAPQLSINAPGIYWAQLSNNCGSNRDSVIISQNIPPNLQLPASTSICEGDSVLLTVTTNAASVQWSTGSTGNSIYALQPGTYQVEAWDVPNCVSNGSVIITPGEVPVFDLGNDTSICSGSEYVISLGLPGLSYRWQDNSTGSTFIAGETGTYAVTVTNECGSTSDEIYLQVFDNGCEIFIPNAFTPNNDGLNDLFMAFSGCPVETFNMRVYNRWGELVHETNTLRGGWDGLYKNGSQYPAVFVYEIDYHNFCQNKIVKKKGSVTLLK